MICVITFHQTLFLSLFSSFVLYLAENYNNAYQGLDTKGNPLRQRQSGKKYNPGRDLTLSAPKSVTLLGLVKEDKPVIEAHDKAVKKTLDYIERNCIFTRMGKGGVNHLQTDNALFAVFQHDDNRNKDPQLHSHCVIFNQTKGAEINCQTLDAYLNIPIKSLPKNELIVVDEAGMISSSQMKKLLERGKQTNSRILLIGDTKQLAAVQAGSPFKLLQDKAGLPTIRIDKNVRQQNVQLKEVVDLLSAGEIKQGYQKLNEQGGIKQIPIDSLRLKAVVNDYLARDDKTQSQTLILAGTNKEKSAITKQVRQGLVEQNKLSCESQQINILKLKDLDKFSLTQASSYEVGDVIKFGHTTARFNKDFYYRVDEVNRQNQTLFLRDSLGNNQSLKLDFYKDRQVFQSETRELRSGEFMKFTRNHYHQGKKQINGQQFTVLGFDARGQIEIKTKGKTQTVNPDALLYSDYRYVDTVHSSQGKTANCCIYAAGSGKSLTVGKESFYVAASRAKHEFKVYTASTKALGLSIEKFRSQENALNLIMKQKLNRQSSTLPTREQEFKLLVAAKYLVQSQGIPDPNNPEVKNYKSADGTEIKRDRDSLIITHQGKGLVFNRDNSTVRNTFTVNEINRQIQARNNEMQQHLNQNRTQTHSRTIGR